MERRSLSLVLPAKNRSWLRISRAITKHSVAALSAIETIEHPSDGALVAVARICFKAEDRLDPKI